MYVSFSFRGNNIVNFIASLFKRISPTPLFQFYSIMNSTNSIISSNEPVQSPLGLKNKEEKKAPSLGSTGQILQDKDRTINELETYYEWHSIDPSSSIFTPRTGHTVTNIGQKAFIFGGFDLDV